MAIEKPMNEVIFHTNVIIFDRMFDNYLCVHVYHCLRDMAHTNESWFNV